MRLRTVVLTAAAVGIGYAPGGVAAGPPVLGRSL